MFVGTEAHAKYVCRISTSQKNCRGQIFGMYAKQTREASAKRSAIWQKYGEKIVIVKTALVKASTQTTPARSLSQMLIHTGVANDRWMILLKAMIWIEDGMRTIGL